VATARYDEFGILLDATGASDAPFGFTGEPTDPTGLVHLRARSYDPELGRFLNRDPWPGVAQVPTTLNRYTYVANNPLRYADPSGECVIDTVVDVGFILFSAVTFITGSEKERDENLTALGLDVAGLAIPCGARLGTVSRVLRAADNAANYTGLARPAVSNSQLRTILSELYRPGASVGPTGSTADAIRHELATGELVGGRSHIQKGQDYVRGLANWIGRNPGAAATDLSAATEVMNDLIDALGPHAP
jgi:RHS repeat-associated protein